MRVLVPTGLFSAMQVEYNSTAIGDRRYYRSISGSLTGNGGTRGGSSDRAGLQTQRDGAAGLVVPSQSGRLASSEGVTSRGVVEVIVCALGRGQDGEERRHDNEAHD